MPKSVHTAANDNDIPAGEKPRGRRIDILPLSLPPIGLYREEAARFIAVSPSQFDKMVADGRMPQPIRIDGRTVWDRRRIERAFDSISETDCHNPWDEVLAT